jgi:two-component system, OmpR family, sensor histidine kinase VicK
MVETNVTQTQRTDVIRGVADAANITILAFSNAKVSWCSVSEANSVGMAVTVDLYRGLYEDLMKRGVEVRALIEITSANIDFAKELLRRGLVRELRHLDGITGNFAVSENEYLASSSIEAQAPVPELIYSNDRQLVRQNQFVFDNLWKKATPADVRFRELEDGAKPETTEVIRGIQETTERIMRFFSSASKEVNICATS